MKIGEYIKSLRTNRGISQEELGKVIGVQRAAVQKWESGAVENLKRSTIVKLADYFEVPASSFIDNYETLTVAPSTYNYQVPIYESVSAGFGTEAHNDIVEYTILPFKTKSEADETLCIRVSGDSMSPKIEDGDLIQVHKQTSVDSGDIAVVLLDGDNGLVKKVEYTEDSITLISLNLNYPPIILKGREILRVSVVGKVKKIIREV